MHNSKLLSILRTFSKNEMKEFVLFVRSPFFTSGRNYPTEKLQQLNAILIRYHPEFESKELTKEKLFKQLYGKKNFNDNALRNLFSDLKELTEEYLKISRYRKTEFEKEHNLLIEYFERKLDKNFLAQLKRNYEGLDSKEKNSELFYDRHRTSDYEAFFKGRNMNLNHKEIQQAYSDFNIFYLLRALQQIILMVNHNAISNSTFDIPLYNEVMAHIKDNDEKYHDIPRIKIYYNLIQMFIKKEEQYFYTLKELLTEKYGTFDIIDRNNLFICLGNYCLEQISKGNKKYHLEKFANDNEYLRSGLIFGKHYFHLNLFMGMAMNALQIKEYMWVENFLKDNSEKVAPELRSFAVNYILGELNYRKLYYDRALRYLAKINDENHYNKQLIRNLTLKIYYDNQHFEEAESLINTSNKFLSGKIEIKDDIRQDLRLFLKYYTKLLRLTQMKLAHVKGFSEYIQQYESELSQEREFRNKDWLLEKLNKL